MLKRLYAVSVLAVLVILSGVAAAQAASPVSCTPGQVFDPTQGTCVIVVAAPPRDGGRVGGGGGGRNSSGVGQPACVKPDGASIPCRDGNSWWSNALFCYIALAVPQPPKSDPIWAGHADGAIYTCYSALVVGGNPMYALWSATPPAGPAAAPDPQVLAQRAIALMGLRAINIGIVPEPRQGSVGIVGMPTWMWAQSPDQSTWGPVTKSASAGGFTVTATASVEQVVWAMGDGSTVVCAGPGAAYRDSFGKESSPSCGHTYTRQGAYTVAATSHWVVRWAGVGQSGTIPLDFTQNANITMGEAQVLVQ